MKKSKILWTLLMGIIAFGSVQANPMFGRKQLLVKDWRFKLMDTCNLKDLQTNELLQWRQVTLPHDWSVEGPYSPDKASATGYSPGGMGWYAKDLQIPANEMGQKVYVYFEGVYNRSKIYINGHLIAERPNGYISFLCDLTPFVQYGKENRLVVQVDHTRESDSRWYTGSGIYRDVYLVYANPVHIDLYGTFCKNGSINKNNADFIVETSLSNESKSKAKVRLELVLIDPENGNKIATTVKKLILAGGDSSKCTQTLKVTNPKLWSIESPYLYQLKTRVFVDGSLTEENVQSVGARTLTYSAENGFALNGKWTKLKGVCIHHDAGCLGSAVPKEVWKRRLLTLKELGCNAIRMSHNPQSPAVYDLCDEIGLVVMDEAFDEWEYPKKKWVKGWNVGTPVFEGSFDFFKEWGERDLRDLILRDRNHPSIIMWSIGNEVDYPNDPYTHPILDHANINQPVQGGYLTDHPKAERLGEISRKLATVVRSYDTSRPVTAALAGVVMSNHTDYPFNLDICGYNYTEDRYEMDHKEFPQRVIYGSENGNGLNSWKTVRDSKNIFAQFIWTGIDYLGESGSWPSRGFNSGLLDFGGNLKPRGYFRRVMWSERPVAYIGTYPAAYGSLSEDAWPVWNYKVGELIRVVSYTNTPQARLLLNGREVGILKPFDEKTFITSWDIPFASGKVEVEGLDQEGKVLCRYAIESSSKPISIQAIPDLKEISKERGVLQIQVKITDEHGVPVFLSEEELNCQIEGPIRLLGMESSNNGDMGDYRDMKQRVYHGSMVVYVQATGETGQAKIRLSAPLLKTAVVDLTIIQ